MKQWSLETRTKVTAAAVMALVQASRMAVAQKEVIKTLSKLNHLHLTKSETWTLMFMYFLCFAFIDDYFVHSINDNF